MHVTELDELVLELLLDLLKELDRLLFGRVHLSKVDGISGSLDATTKDR